VPFAGRFHYTWIVVDLEWCGPEARPEVAAAALRAGYHTGLVLTRSPAPAARSPFVDWIDCGSLLGSATGSLDAVVQVVRSILLYLPAARVFVSGLAELAVLLDALGRHDVLVAVDPENDRLDTLDDASRRRGGSSAPPFAAIRSRIRALPSGAELRDLFDQSTDLRDAALATLVRCDEVLIKGDTGRGTLAMHRWGVAGEVLPFSDYMIARHCSPTRLPFGPRRPAVAEDPSDSVRIVDLAPAERRTGRRCVFSCFHLLGDLLSTTPTIRAHRSAHPDDHITLMVVDDLYSNAMRLSPDVDRLVFVPGLGWEEVVMRSSHARASQMAYFQGDFDARHVFDVQTSPRSDESGRELHMTESYAAQYGVTLSSRRPVLDVAAALESRPVTTPDAPFVVLSRHTVSGGTIGPGHPRTKRWSEIKWRMLARRIRSELGLVPVSIGTADDPPLSAAGVVNLHGYPIVEIAGLLAAARALVVIDNGIFHLGMAMGTPLVHLYPMWLGEHWVAACPELPHRDLHAPLDTFTVDVVFGALRDLLTEVGALP
jgi:hypothetical protein